MAEKTCNGKHYWHGNLYTQMPQFSYLHYCGSWPWTYCSYRQTILAVKPLCRYLTHYLYGKKERRKAAIQKTKRINLNWSRGHVLCLEVLAWRRCTRVDVPCLTPAARDCGTLASTIHLCRLVECTQSNGKRKWPLLLPRIGENSGSSRHSQNEGHYCLCPCTLLFTSPHEY